MVYALSSLYFTTLLKDYKKLLVTNGTINLVTYKLHTLNSLSRSILSGPLLGKDPLWFDSRKRPPNLRILGTR